VHFSRREKRRHSVFPAQVDKILRDVADDFRGAAEQVVKRDAVVNESPGGRMSGLVRARRRFFADRKRPFDIAQGPACLGEVARCGGGAIRAEPEPGVAIALRIVQPQRLN
jgi:hypothetical protein